MNDTPHMQYAVICYEKGAMWWFNDASIMSYDIAHNTTILEHAKNEQKKKTNCFMDLINVQYKSCFD